MNKNFTFSVEAGKHLIISALKPSNASGGISRRLAELKPDKTQPMLDNCCNIDFTEKKMG